MKVVTKKRRVDEVVTYTCDLCGAAYGHTMPGDSEWGETTIKCATGTSDGYGGGDGKMTEFHACPACFVDKLAPALVALGLRQHIIESDW